MRFYETKASSSIKGLWVLNEETILLIYKNQSKDGVFLYNTPKRVIFSQMINICEITGGDGLGSFFQPHKVDFIKRVFTSQKDLTWAYMNQQETSSFWCFLDVEQVAAWLPSVNLGLFFGDGIPRPAKGLVGFDGPYRNSEWAW